MKVVMISYGAIDNIWYLWLASSFERYSNYVLVGVSKQEAKQVFKEMRKKKHKTKKRQQVFFIDWRKPL